MSEFVLNGLVKRRTELAGVLKTRMNRCWGVGGRFTLAIAGRLQP